MSTLYSALVYAQAPASGSYASPAIPSTFVAPAFTPPGWSPYSASAADRTIYWVDTAGTLTEQEALVACFGTAGALAYQAGAAIPAGMTLTLSGSYTLAATLFPTDTDTQTKLAAVMTTVNSTQAFPGGASTYPMKDSADSWHTFTVSQYTAVAGALAGYVSALVLITDGNPLGVTTLPAASAALTLP